MMKHETPKCGYHFKQITKPILRGAMGSSLSQVQFCAVAELIRYRARPTQAPHHLQVQGTHRREVTSTSKRLDCNLQLGWKKGLRKSIASILSIWFFSCFVRFLHVPIVLRTWQFAGFTVKHLLSQQINQSLKPHFQDVCLQTHEVRETQRSWQLSYRDPRRLKCSTLLTLCWTLGIHPQNWHSSFNKHRTSSIFRGHPWHFRWLLQLRGDQIDVFVKGFLLGVR